MSKKYTEMTPAERLADRIAKNREIDQRIKEDQSAAASAPATASSRRKAASGDALAEFHRIKKERGIDAASEFVNEKK
jgi:hypothetical protein